MVIRNTNKDTFVEYTKTCITKSKVKPTQIKVLEQST